MSAVEREPVATQSISITQPAGPAKWKLAVSAFAGLYPLVTLASWAVARTVPQWALPARTLLVIVLVVPIMTYLVTPTMHRHAGRWLHSLKKHRDSK
ncbi:hypothetical protein [Nocardia sp. NBC_01388]|uniref:hypothetical protein n=1 Tax=Nocardia sp. NBC_01388 TaxID=2903596 RepID=UPI003252BE25